MLVSRTLVTRIAFAAAARTTGAGCLQSASAARPSSSSSAPLEPLEPTPPPSSTARTSIGCNPRGRSVTPAVRACLLPSQVQKKTVPALTYRLLQAGDEAIAHVRRTVLPHGAGNTRHDLDASNGRSLDAMAYTRRCVYDSAEPAKTDREKVARLAAIARAGRGGNCEEYAVSVAAALNRTLPKGTPISVCDLPDLDHAFVVLEDPRKASPGDYRGMVFVDAWPAKAQAVTGEDFKFLEKSVAIKVHWLLTADGEDLVSARTQKVLNAYGRPAAAHDPPELRSLGPKGMRIWPDTHVTRGDVRIEYQPADE